MKRAIFENFQGHKKTVIDLADTLTAITGQSDQGKSSLIRGFRFVRDNKPNGTAFIRLGTKEAIVTLDKVKHSRTAKVNKYEVEGHPKPFKALRGAVPEEVTTELNLGEENIQGQHAKPFLLDDSPGKVAQQLSTLVNLEAPTNALKFLASKKRTHNASAEALRTSIEATETQLTQLDHVGQADNDLAVIESEKAYIDRLHVKRATLYKAYVNAVRATQELSGIPSIDALIPAKRLVKHYHELKKMKSAYTLLKSTTDNILSIERTLSFNPKKLLSKAKRLKKLKDKRNRIAATLHTAMGLQKTIGFLAETEARLIKEKYGMLKDGCPLCGRS